MNDREELIGRLMGIMRDAGDQSSNDALYHAMAAVVDDKNTCFLNVYPSASSNELQHEDSVGVVAITTYEMEGRAVHMIRLFYMDEPYKRSWCAERTVENEMRRYQDDDWGYVVRTCDQDVRVRLANLFFINGYVSLPCRTLGDGYVATRWRRKSMVDYGY